jgi:hypothetical protein
LRILITNYDLTQHGGAQLYVRDLATSLLSRGHQPLVYSPALGSVAGELAKAGVPVTDNLASIELPPDLIHGNQQVETMTALLFFPGTPAVYFCHSARNWMEAPPVFPRILRYVAVDDVCYRRLTDEHGIKPTQAQVILNFVDLERFKPRGPLPDKPRRALVFSNYAHDGTHLGVVRAACQRAAIELEVIGESAGRLETRPELKIGQYDLVFAKARAALEALATGAAVVLCDTAGVGPMVTTGELDSLRRLNFGFRTLTGPLTVEAVEQQIARYDRRDAATVSERIRATAGSVAAIDQIVELYEELICEWQHCAVSAEDEGRAAARYVRQLYDDFAFHGAFTMRWRKRLLRIPLAGPRIVAWREKSGPNQKH